MTLDKTRHQDRIFKCGVSRGILPFQLAAANGGNPAADDGDMRGARRIFVKRDDVRRPVYLCFFAHVFPPLSLKRSV
ncbi:MAG: hypothetical protein MPK36_10095 [Gammaproteobacteria bacterium]|nr:hypothetical protein [Gammaproteobacteria bacterium]